LPFTVPLSSRKRPLQAKCRTFWADPSIERHVLVSEYADLVSWSYGPRRFSCHFETLCGGWRLTLSAR
jgi:hypothetical protein